jgi:hypothetical protein
MRVWPLRIDTMKQVTNVVVASEQETNDRMTAAGSVGALTVVALGVVAVTAPVAAVTVAVALAGAVMVKRLLEQRRRSPKTGDRSRPTGSGHVTAD